MAAAVKEAEVEAKDTCNQTSASTKPITSSSSDAATSHLQHLAVQVQHNLRYQHEWTDLRIHTRLPRELDRCGRAVSGPLITGVPPQRLYIHPDEQIEIIKREQEKQTAEKHDGKDDVDRKSAGGGDDGDDNGKGKGKGNSNGNGNGNGNGDGDGNRVEPALKPVTEWVLPTHLREKWSLKMFADVFDTMDQSQRDEDASGERSVAEHGTRSADGPPPRKTDGAKRILLATVSDDSTVVYYIIHDGLVKPRQN